MNILLGILLGAIEKEIENAAPEVAKFLLEQLKLAGGDLVIWAEKKLNVDINGDGIIGENNDETRKG